MAKDPLAAETLFEHVQDAEYFHVPRALTADGSGHIYLPQPFKTETPIFEAHTGIALVDDTVQPMRLALSKFMVIEVVVALIIAVFFISYAHRVRGGALVRGWWWNLLETFVTFIRDEVARPAIGKHDADRFLPFLWTMFFFVLGCNLMGMIPWMGSPTGSLACTGALALCSFLVVIGSGMAKLGVAGFWKAQVPHMDLPFVLAIFLVPMIFIIEIIGLLIKHFVLAVRLLANMLAGHVVLAVIIAFISASAASMAWYGVAPASVLGAAALSLMELFFAFLQAYIFTVLSALFIGAAVHPH